MGLSATVLPIGSAGRVYRRSRTGREPRGPSRRRRARRNSRVAALGQSRAGPSAVPGRRPVVRVRVPSRGPDHRRLQEPRGDPPRGRGERPVQPDRTRRHQEDGGLHGRPGQRVQCVRAKITGAGRVLRAVFDVIAVAGVHRRRGNHQSGRGRRTGQTRAVVVRLEAAEEHARRARNQAQQRLLIAA